MLPCFDLMSPDCVRLHVCFLLISSSTMLLWFPWLNPLFQPSHLSGSPAQSSGLTVPQLAVLFGLSCRGQGLIPAPHPPTPSNLKIGWGSRTLPRASKSIQSARAKVTLLHSPRLCSSFVCFILQVLLCGSNKPAAPHQKLLSCAPHHDC